MGEPPPLGAQLRKNSGTVFGFQWALLTLSWVPLFGAESDRPRPPLTLPQTDSGGGPLPFHRLPLDPPCWEGRRHVVLPGDGLGLVMTRGDGRRILIIAADSEIASHDILHQHRRGSRGQRGARAPPPIDPRRPLKGDGAPLKSCFTLGL